MTVYILEGPDFAGKTTLASELQKMLELDGRDVIREHSGPDADVSAAELFVKYVDALSYPRSSGSDVVVDRLHVGETIYGPMYRGASRLSIDQTRAVDQLADQLCAVKIFVDAADGDLLHRFRGTRGDDLVKDEETLLAIAHQYRTWIGAHGILKGWVHWTTQHSVAAGFRRGPVA